MIVAKTIQNVRSAIAQTRDPRSRAGLVPTMGALHAGHVSLIESARRECPFIVVSIFVNPTQFAPGEDFERYPRPMERDLEICRSRGVHCVFAPQPAEIYPGQQLTTVHVAQLSHRLCGPFRPGHFDGVATVVHKLFQIVQPDAAYFGEKDYQQLQIIRRMVRDLNMPVEIVGCPTVREPDGLAMSSRNAYLSPSARKQAALIYAGLQAAVQAAATGTTAAARIIEAARATIESAGPCIIEYVSLADAETLAELAELDCPARLCVAVRIENTRLIDNTGIYPQRG